MSQWGGECDNYLSGRTNNCRTLDWVQDFKICLFPFPRCGYYPDWVEGGRRMLQVRIFAMRRALGGEITISLRNGFFWYTWEKLRSHFLFGKRRFLASSKVIGSSSPNSLLALVLSSSSQCQLGGSNCLGGVLRSSQIASISWSFSGAVIAEICVVSITEPLSVPLLGASEILLS